MPEKVNFYSKGSFTSILQSLPWQDIFASKYKISDISIFSFFNFTQASIDLAPAEQWKTIVLSFGSFSNNSFALNLSASIFIEPLICPFSKFFALKTFTIWIYFGTLSSRIWAFNHSPSIVPSSLPSFAPFVVNSFLTFIGSTVFTFVIAVVASPASFHAGSPPA